MTIDLEKIIQFKSKIQLEQIYNIFVSVMIAVNLVLAIIALCPSYFRPTISKRVTTCCCSKAILKRKKWLRS